MPNETTTELAVIGGGLAGLAAAAVAGRAGRRVKLFEKAGGVGGRATTQVKDGFAFNVGPHALYRGGAGMRLLNDLGIAPRGAPPRPSGGHAVRRGVKHPFPSGFVSLVTTGLLPLPAKLEVAKLLSRLPGLDPEPLARLSVVEGLARIARREEVRELLAALFRLATYGNAPDRQSCGASLAQLKLALSDNVLYLDGGWQQLVDGLRAAAVAAGVDIVEGVRVEAVVLSGAEQGVSALRLSDGGELACTGAILAVPPHDAAAAVGGPAGDTLARWAADSIPLQAACLDLALDRLPVPRSTFALGIDAPLYFSVHSAVARLAPGDGALVHLARYLDPSEPADADRDLREMEHLADLVQPGWRDHVVHRRFLPHMTVAHGLVRADRAGTAGRPGPGVPGTRGLYVAGDWVGREGMLADASLGSARQAAERYLREAPALAAAAA